LSEVKPKYNDFGVKTLILKKFAEEGMFKGENYRYIVLKKQFYTLKIGKLTIEPLSMDVDVQLPTNRRTFWPSCSR
jgi:hypothetical protein